MLYLTRKIGESVVINDEIEVTVVDVRGKSIKLGFTFPENASVLRKELHERIQMENRAAAETGEAIDSTVLLDALAMSAPAVNKPAFSRDLAQPTKPTTDEADKS